MLTAARGAAAEAAPVSPRAWASVWAPPSSWEPGSAPPSPTAARRATVAALHATGAAWTTAAAEAPGRLGVGANAGVARMAPTCTCPGNGVRPLALVLAFLPRPRPRRRGV